MLPKIQILTFGTLQVVRGDYLVTEGDWHTRQARQLLKILITERPRPVSTDRLIEILWSQSTPEAAATTLRSAINALRNVLEPDRVNRAPSRYIVTQNPGYAFHLLPEVWLDVAHFEQTLTLAQNTPEPAARKQLLQEAVALYQDDYLVSDPYADWAQPERERLRERYFTALLNLAELQAAQGDYPTAIGNTRKILARDEVRENAYQALMRYQAESGDSAGALLTFERCRTILADELGADPSPLTQTWHQRILNGEIAARETQSVVMQSAVETTQTLASATDTGTQRPPIPTTLPQHLLMPSVDVRALDLLVGRDREVEEMRSWLDDALAGRGNLLVLEGEAGIGKTRLAVTLLQAAADAGATVISATCQAIEKDLPFSALADILGRYLHRIPTDALHLLPAASLAQMAQIVPSLYDRIPGLTAAQPHLVASLDENRQRLLEGIITFLTTLAQLKPLALFIDDLHWADPDTLALISRLSQRLGEHPLFLLLAYRSDDLAENEALSTLLHALRNRQGNRQGSRIVQVRRFDRAQVQQYADLLTGSNNAISDELVRLLYEMTQGNPLYVAELLRDLRERHPEVVRDPQVAGADETPVPSAEVRQMLATYRNRRVQELILERLERLPDAALWVLQLSAVIARDYSLELLELAATSDPISGLEILLERNFLIERPDQRLDFSHQIVRQVAYESMSALQRRRWHLRVAEGLITLRRAAHNPAEAAFHLSQAGAQARVQYAHYATLAGEKLLRAYGFYQAIDFFDGALAAYELAPDATSAAIERALQGRALAFESLFDVEGATDSYRRMLELARVSNDRSLILRTHSRMATVLGLLGQARESHELLQELIRILPNPEQPATGKDDDSTQPVESYVIRDLLARRSVIYSADEGELAESTWAAYTPPPPVVADPVHDLLQVLEPVHAVLPLFDYGWTLLVQGQLGEATLCLSAVVDLAIETVQPSLASTALHQLAVTARILGELEQSQALNEQSVAINREVTGTASELASMWPRIASALLSLQAGKVDEAERRLQRVITSLSERSAYSNYRNSANIGLGLVALARGHLDEAQRLLDGALTDPVNLYPYMHVRALHGLARIARARGNSAAADALLRKALHFAGTRSLLEEYIETVLEIAQQQPANAPIEDLIRDLLDYIRPIQLNAAIARLENTLAQPEVLPI